VVLHDKSVTRSLYREGRGIEASALLFALIHLGAAVRGFELKEGTARVDALVELQSEHGFGGKGTARVMGATRKLRSGSSA
jgi:hypothetical protein